MKNETLQKPATVGQLKALYQWIYVNCPERPSKFSGYTKIIHRLIKCQTGSDSRPLKPVHLRDYNKINKDHPLKESTFRQRPTEIAQYLLQPASKRIECEQRLKMRIKSSEENRQNPSIIFELDKYQLNFLNAIKKVDSHFDDNQWLCEAIRAISTNKNETFTPSQRKFSQTIQPTPLHDPDTLNWFSEQNWETASVFIVITPMDPETDVLKYKEELQTICNKMNGAVYSNYINEEYIFGFQPVSEMYLKQAVDASLKFQAKIRELDEQRKKEQRPHVLMLVSEDWHSQDGDRLTLTPSQKNIAYRTKLFNNTDLQHNSILVTPEVYSKIHVFYSFNKMELLPLYKYERAHQDGKRKNAQFTGDITLLDPDGHFGKVDAIKSLCNKATIVSLAGEIGIGKTRLLYCLSKTLQADPAFQMSYLSCCDYNKNTPYSFAEAFYRHLVKPTEHSGKPHLEETSFEDFLSNFSTDEWTNTRVDCPIHFDEQKVWIIAIDNAQWIDRASLNILNNFNSIICKCNLPITMVYSWRYETLKPEGYPIQSLSLGTLSSIGLTQIAQNINQQLLNNKYSMHQLDDMAEQAEGIPLALVEMLCPDRLPTTYFKKILCTVDNASTDQERCKEVVLAATQIGNHFKIDHITGLVAEELVNAPEKEVLYQYISNCLDEMKRLHIIEKKPNQWFCFSRENIRQQILKALPGNLNDMHKKIARDLYKNHKQDCYTDPLLIGSHLLNLNEFDGFSIINAIKFMRRSAWVEINKSKFDCARDYFAKIFKLTKKIKKQKTHIKFYTKLSTSTEMLFLDILHGKPSKTIEEKLNNLLKKIYKRPDDESQYKLLEFEIQWLQCYHTYLKGNLKESEAICQKLIKTQGYRRTMQCKQLLHALRAKIYFKTGRISGSIIESRIASDILANNDLENRILLKTIDDIALAQWLSGYTDQAIMMLDNAEKTYLKKNNIRGRITTDWNRILLHTMDYDAEKVAFCINRAERNEIRHLIMSARGFTAAAPHLLTLVRIINGEKNDMNGLEATIQKLRKHTTLYKPFWKTLLAEAYLKIDNYEDCSRCIGDAFNTTDNTGERFYLPEAHRVNAELKLKIGQKKDAKYNFDIALSIAQENNTPMLELRALNSLFLNHITLNKKEKERTLTRISEIMKTFDNKKTTFDIHNARKILKA